jgi:MFS transporter, AAHS family, 4-hydroxybenzoate transporter
VLLGWLGDRIGRRSSYIVCIAFLFAGSLLSAYSTNLWELFSWRVLTGIGLGGVTPLAATMISEWTPRHARNVAVAFAVVAVPTGGMIGAGVAQWVIPTYGWRTIFYIGAVLPLFFLVIAWFLLPESPRYLALRRDKHPVLARHLNRLLRTKRFDGTETFMVAEPPAAPGNWFTTLLKPPYLSTTLLLWGAFAFNTLCLYAYVNWLPTVLSSIGMPLQDSLQGSKLFNFGGFFGAVGGSVLIGYLGSRIVGSSLAFIGAIATFLVGVVLLSSTGSADAQLLALIFVAGMALNGMQCFLYAVGAHSYPTYIRASGVGCAQTVSRIGGVLSSVVGGAFFAVKPQPPVSYFFYVVGAAILVVVISFFSLRTHIQGGSRARDTQGVAEAKGATP